MPRTGTLNYEEFLLVMGEKNRETDIEIHYKDTFRAFSKDDDGCIPAEEMIFVFQHLGVSLGVIVCFMFSVI